MVPVMACCFANWLSHLLQRPLPEWNVFRPLGAGQHFPSREDKRPQIGISCGIGPIRFSRKTNSEPSIPLQNLYVGML